MMHHALPAGCGDGEVAAAYRGAWGGDFAFGEEAEGTRDAVEEGVCRSSFARFGGIGRVFRVVFEAKGAPCSAIETFSGRESGRLQGALTFR